MAMMHTPERGEMFTGGGGRESTAGAVAVAAVLSSAKEGQNAQSTAQ